VSPDAREGRLGPALLVALLVAALIAGIFVYRARTADLALEVPTLDRLQSKEGDGEFPAEIEFFVRFDEPDATVQIVGRGDAPVRTLAEGVELRDGELIRCEWQGYDDDGDPAPPGNYRLRVVLPGQDRDMVFPLRMLVRMPVAEPNEGSRSVTVTSPECQRTETGEVLE
jgi:hypothetical protein